MAEPEELNPVNFNDLVLKQTDAVVVYFTDSKIEADIEKEYKYISQLQRQIAGAIRFCIFRITEEMYPDG